jgi:formate transporter
MSYKSPIHISEDFRKSAGQKAGMAISHQIVYGILGGVFISFGGLLAVTVAGGMPGIAASNPGLVKLAFGALFPVGLITIIIAGAQLFTSDCAILPYGWLRGEISLRACLKTWCIIYFSNFIGALIVAYFFASEAGLLSGDPWRKFIGDLAIAKTSAPFYKIFIKAIGANWLVCLAAWMSYAAKDVAGKVIAIWIPVMCFVVLGLEHSIANMFFIPAAMFNGTPVSVTDMILNLIPATLGNIAGGIIGVALPYWFVFDYNATRKTEPIVLEPLKEFERNLN